MLTPVTVAEPADRRVRRATDSRDEPRLLVPYRPLARPPKKLPRGCKAAVSARLQWIRAKNSRLCYAA